MRPLKRLDARLRALEAERGAPPRASDDLLGYLTYGELCALEERLLADDRDGAADLLARAEERRGRGDRQDTPPSAAERAEKEAYWRDVGAALARARETGTIVTGAEYLAMRARAAGHR